MKLNLWNLSSGCTVYFCVLTLITRPYTDTKAKSLRKQNERQFYLNKFAVLWHKIVLSQQQTISNQLIYGKLHICCNTTALLNYEKKASLDLIHLTQALFWRYVFQEFAVCNERQHKLLLAKTVVQACFANFEKIPFACNFSKKTPAPPFFLRFCLKIAEKLFFRTPLNSYFCFEKACKALKFNTSKVLVELHFMGKSACFTATKDLHKRYSRIMF